MSSAFADIHTMVAILTKSEASAGFDQIINFLNGSYIQYALTINPHIYVSCIKQFWNTITVKQSNDVTRLQALIDRKRVVVTETVIRDVLHLDDAEGVDCLPNEEIFAGLARMGYEKPSTKLTFYKAFFSTVICLSVGRKFNFSKYIFDSLVRNVDSNLKFYMYPRFIHLIIQNQLGDLSTHTTKYISPALTQKVFANMRRVGKGCSGVETPLFEGMLVAKVIEEQNDAEEQIQGNDNDAQGADTNVSGDDVQDQFIPSPAPPNPPPPPPPQDIPSTSQVQSPLPQPQSPTPAQPQGADFLMSLLQEALDACAALTRRVKHLEHNKVTQDLEITKLKTRVKKLERANKVKTLKLRRLKKVGTSQRVNTSDDTIMEDVSNQGRMIDELDRDEGVALMGEKEEEKKAEEVKVIAGNGRVQGRQAEIQAEIYQIDMDYPSKVLKVATTANAPVSAASTIILAVEPKIPAATITQVKVATASTRRRRGVIIRDPEEESSAKTPAETKSKDKGKEGQGGSLCAEVSGDEEKALDRSSSSKEYDHVFEEYCWIQIGLL
nr:hypothetical protein [Tanacetum cinerariifolium]